jgi:prevent-host-death family protein
MEVNMSNTQRVAWQASDARNNFPEVMRRALAGEPQLVRHRNGDEVVVVSRREYDTWRPTLKEFLLRGGACGDDNDLEEAIARNRSEGITVLGKYPRDGR